MQYKLMVYLNEYIEVLNTINSILSVVWIGLWIYLKAEWVEYIMGFMSASSGHMSMYP